MFPFLPMKNASFPNCSVPHFLLATTYKCPFFALDKSPFFHCPHPFPMEKSHFSLIHGHFFAFWEVHPFHFYMPLIKCDTIPFWLLFFGSNSKIPLLLSAPFSCNKFSYCTLKVPHLKSDTCQFASHKCMRFFFQNLVCPVSLPL